jgi:hypothetical protein
MKSWGAVQRKSRFQTVCTKETQNVWEKIYKLCNSKRYTYKMSVYLDIERKRTTAAMTATHAAVSGLTTRIKNLGQTLH